MVQVCCIATKNYCIALPLFGSTFFIHSSYSQFMSGPTQVQPQSTSTTEKHHPCTSIQ
ncbi:hypothetical protein CEXT_740791, partial [Caerostris extrusa]